MRVNEFDAKFRRLTVRVFALSRFLVLFSFTVFAEAVPVLEQSVFHADSIEEYRRFALQNDGDGARGVALFRNEERLACTKCHSTDGKGGKAGPDLFSIGDQFSRSDLIDAVLHPSKTIAVGYNTTVVKTKSDEVIEGVLKQSTDAWIELACATGQRTRIAREEIREQRGSLVSLMPEGLQNGLTLQEFADLIEFLVSLKESTHSLVSCQGMPEFIPELRSPVPLLPFLTEPLRFSEPGSEGRPNAQFGLVGFAQIPGCSNEFLAVDQCGIIWRIEKTATRDRITTFADFRSEVFSARGPNGLLGFAFHPRFRENRKYYLKHQVFEHGQIATILAEKRASSNFATDSSKPSRRLLEIASGAEHHNGGCIAFGPDGFLYLGMGDSAPNDDPQGHAQDLGLLLGKMLRVDIDHPEGAQNYAIPADNPLRDQVQARPEIWAWGFREPWRFTFDSVTGDLWVADLGQERGDEIAIVRRAENHGWNIYQGFELFAQRRRRENVTYVAPIFVPRRKQGSTIIGGYVYRGDQRSSFYGVYIFGDYTSKRIWGLTQENRSLQNIRQIAMSPQAITSFSTDDQGSLYVVGQQGMVYRLDLSKAEFQDQAAVSATSGE